jgi:hypothetical protein
MNKQFFPPRPDEMLRNPFRKKQTVYEVRLVKNNNFTNCI